jgi:hypothetical protein
VLIKPSSSFIIDTDLLINIGADNVTRHQIRDAVRCHFEPANLPKMIRFVHDEVLAT